MNAEMASRLRVWNYEVCRNVFRRKRQLLARPSGVQKALDSKPNEFLMKLDRELRSQYEEVLFQEERLLWYQKSQSKGISFGDRNFKFNGGS